MNEAAFILLIVGVLSAAMIYAAKIVADAIDRYAEQWDKPTEKDPEDWWKE